MFVFCGYGVLALSRKPYCQTLFSMKTSLLKLLFVDVAFASDIECSILAPPTSNIIKRALGNVVASNSFFYARVSLHIFFSNDNFFAHVNICEIINIRPHWSVNIKCYTCCYLLNYLSCIMSATV